MLSFNGFSARKSAAAQLPTPVGGGLKPNRVNVLRACKRLGYGWTPCATDGLQSAWTRKFRWLGRSRSLGIAPMKLGFADASPEFLFICLKERSFV